MADKVTVKAERRDTRGSNDARRLRASGKVPMALYGGGEGDLAVVADLSDLAAILRSDSGVNTIFSLDVDGVGATDVIFHDRQIDPLRGTLMHADLRRIAKGEKIEVTVTINLVGEPAGEVEEGGVVTQQLREIKIFCESNKIPESIEVDISNLTANEAIHVSEIKVDEGVEIHEAPETVVASIVVIKELDLEPTPESEITEPELVGEDDEAATDSGATESE